YRAAQADLATLDPEVTAGLQAYSRGVNEFLHTHADSLPLEFTLAGLKMEDWQPADSLAFGKLQAWDLTNSWGDDLFNSDLIAKVGITLSAQLLPSYPKDGPFIVPRGMTGSISPELAALDKKLRAWMPD